MLLLEQPTYIKQMLKSTVHLHKFSNLAHHTYNSKPPAFTAKPPNPFILTPSHLSHQNLSLLFTGFKTLHKHFEHCRVKTNGLYFILNQKLSLNQGSCFWSVLSPGISSPSPPHLPKAVENSQYIIEVNTFRTIFLMIYVLYFASVLLERIAAFFFWAPGPVYS